MSESYEIERKFLVSSLPEGYSDSPHERLRQGYLASAPNEIRLRAAGSVYTLTCKQGSGVQRREEEIEILPEHFEKLWPLTSGKRVEKTRYRIPYQTFTIELDLYEGDLCSLRTAEVEFENAVDCEAFQPPPFFGNEVTHDSRYKNQSLAEHGLPKS